MADLYFFPMACSLASRIAALEAGIELNYHRVELFGDKSLVGEAGSLSAISALGKVPVLVLDDGGILTENAAVLQVIADLNPGSGLAPSALDPARYELQQWLSFVATELHKGFLFPTFAKGTPDTVKAWVREQLVLPLSFAASRLDKTGDYLICNRFTVADAYLIWALLLIQAAGVELGSWPALTAYCERVVARPCVGAAIALERDMYRAGKAS
ncbi:glutathione binding-like protein [Dokdonella sp.]|uniref:glutathione binding-like protein n=1 Tax=Dokdonella sp. TaxID=2291710 RepID=UPI003529B90E